VFESKSHSDRGGLRRGMIAARARSDWAEKSAVEDDENGRSEKTRVSRG
jgi:hypothetical protein